MGRGLSFSGQGWWPLNAAGVAARVAEGPGSLGSLGNALVAADAASASFDSAFPGQLDKMPVLTLLTIMARGHKARGAQRRFRERRQQG